jgi:hypothetical protein
MAGNCEWASELLSTVQIFAHSGGTAWSFGCATRRFRQFYRDNTETRLIVSGFPKGNQTRQGMALYSSRHSKRLQLRCIAVAQSGIAGF